MGERGMSGPLPDWALEKACELMPCFCGAEAIDEHDDECPAGARPEIAKALLAAYAAGQAAPYSERNHVVALLARLFPSGIRNTDIPGWDAEWHGCVYIDLPSGQISYHYHDSEAHLFDGLPPYTQDWDGHDKAAVHERLKQACSYAAGQAGGGDRIAALEEAAKVADAAYSAAEREVYRASMRGQRDAEIEAGGRESAALKIAEAIRSLLPPQTSTRDGMKEEKDSV
jgi:hypothetical protein